MSATWGKRLTETDLAYFRRMGITVDEIAGAHRWTLLLLDDKFKKLGQQQPLPRGINFRWWSLWLAVGAGMWWTAYYALGPLTGKFLAWWWRSN